MSRMDSEMLLRVRKAISPEPTPTRENAVVEQAKRVLVALGLDDLSVFAYRVWKDLPGEVDRADVESAIRAALVATGEGLWPTSN